MQHLHYALRPSGDSFLETSALQQRIMEIQQLKKEQKQLL